MRRKLNLILNNRDFCILFLGQFVSTLGSGINTIGMSLYVLKFDNPILGIGALSIITTLPWVLLASFSGVLADRYSKKNIMIICDILRGILGIFLFFADNIILFYILTLIMSIFNVIFAPATSGFLPFILKEDELEEANSIYAGSGELAFLIGPIIGGWLVALFGPALVFMINGFSYIISGISEYFINTDGIIKKEETQNQSVLKEIKEGYIYTKNHTPIKFVILFFGIIALSIGALRILGSNHLVNELNVSDSTYGLFMAICGVGAILGAVILPKLTKIFKPIELMVYSVSIYGLVYLIFILTSFIPIAFISYFFVGIFGGLIDISYGVFLQKSIDKEFIGRVFSLDMTLSSFSSIIAMIFVTTSSTSIGESLLLKVFTYLMIISGIIATITLRKLNLHKDIVSINAEIESNKNLN